ncbi:hypothetical protein I350_07122 [Cryptococcus amylolentus CBS 6273]|uniref:Histone acetyltransferase n=1 Tax=Cryptococcus amylolentus CBS 6273 TaxID=1296118 RepID=A0A1E3JDM1_9TREE|nr:hypothetical protein I350_07122 [Cryptococcus amylolentus CBS 6273]
MASTSFRIVPRDPTCSFCNGTDAVNPQGRQERMITCSSCGRSGHPSCLGMATSTLVKKVMMYDWHCQDCKTCEECRTEGDVAQLLFCDSCDRGYHGYCLNPPLAQPPNALWHCPKCSSPPIPTAPPRSHKKKMPNPSKAGAGRPTPISTPSAPRPRGRPPKQKKPLTDDQAVFADSRIKVKIPNPNHRAPTEDRATPMIVRLRVPSAKRLVEEETEEEKVPYGGIITGEDADTSRTKPQADDKERYEKARKEAEFKMGGPMPQRGNSVVPGSPMATPPPATGGKFTPAKAPPARPLRDRLLQQSLPDAFPFPPTPGPSTPGPPTASPWTGGTNLDKIKTIRFGTFDIDTWYSAPYPEEYAYVPDGRLWLCEFCLKYMKSGFASTRHRLKCKARHPPGDEIYRSSNISVFEVDGRKNKIYCQNLCLLAKMFLDHKTLYYDVEPFLFYVMTEVDELGARFVGYFSKEKRSRDNNVSCIMTLPVRQRKGWGQLLIDFSYSLSKKEGRVGSPEKPLSGLGAVSYKSYWRISVFKYLAKTSDPAKLTLKEISKGTSMTIEDIYTILLSENMINILDSAPLPTPLLSSSARRGRGRPPVRRKGDPAASVEPEDGHGHTEEIVKIPKKYEILVDMPYIQEVLERQEKKGHLKLEPERLKYHPFIVARQSEKGDDGEGEDEEEEQEGEEIEDAIVRFAPRLVPPPPVIRVAPMTPHHRSHARQAFPDTPTVQTPLVAPPTRSLRKRKSDVAETPQRALRSRDSKTLVAEMLGDQSGKGVERMGVPNGMGADGQEAMDVDELPLAGGNDIPIDPALLFDDDTPQGAQFSAPHDPSALAFPQVNYPTHNSEFGAGAGGMYQSEVYGYDEDAEGEDEDAEGEEWVGEDEDAEGEEWDEDYEA